MAGEAGFDLAQALRARQLPVQKGDEPVSGRQPAHPRIGPVRIHQPIEHMPWHVLQDSVEYAILMPHGVDLLPCPDTLPDVRRTEESTPCALSTKTQPDSRAMRRALACVSTLVCRASLAICKRTHALIIDRRICSVSFLLVHATWAIARSSSFSSSTPHICGEHRARSEFRQATAFPSAGQPQVPKGRRRT